MAVKLSDVAQQAKVSTATVSRALSQPHKVKLETLKRIERTVKKLGYITHGTARALATRKTMTIGAVVPTLHNSIFANTIHTLQKTLDAAGYTLIISCHEFDLQAEARLARSLIERGVDGIILVGLEHTHDLIKLLQSLNVPYIFIWSLDTTGRYPCVGFNVRQAAQRLTNYLIDMGHTEFAVISGMVAGNDYERNRVVGIKEALEKRGLTLPTEHFIEKPYSFMGGREGLRVVMKTKPTAVICGNDVLAIGALAECRAQKINVPQQLSITGFDDLDIASMVTPALTTMRIPRAEVGQRAADYILAKLANKAVPEFQELSIDIVVRESTAPPASKN